MELEFYGAAGRITGSCHVLRINGHQILLNCGLIQGRPEEEALNREGLSERDTDFESRFRQKKLSLIRQDHKPASLVEKICDNSPCVARVLRDVRAAADLGKTKAIELLEELEGKD